jgi:hypothetical protein
MKAKKLSKENFNPAEWQGRSYERVCRDAKFYKYVFVAAVIIFAVLGVYYSVPKIFF